MLSDPAFSPDIALPFEGTLVGNKQRFGRGWRAGPKGWQPVHVVPGELPSGYGINYRSGFASIYVDADELWLQVGRRGWNCAEIESVDQCVDLIAMTTYRLTLRSGRTERVTLKMPRSVILGRLTDPTYDEIDSWGDDLLKTFPYTAVDGWSGGGETMGEWRSRIIESWSRRGG